MAYTLQQLSDFEDIRTLKHRYYRGIDTADMALLSGLFTDDVTVDYRSDSYLVKLQGRDNMLEFLASSFHSDALAMHHGHMPDIKLTGDTTATGIWYLEDIFINLGTKNHCIGTAIYRDRYRKVADTWKIEHTEYDRIIEINMPLADNIQIASHYLAKHGLKPEDRKDISHLIHWTNS
jgi:hypothetical protein